MHLASTQSAGRAQAAAAPRRHGGAAAGVAPTRNVVPRAGGFFDTNPAFKDALQTALERDEAAAAELAASQASSYGYSRPSSAGSSWRTPAAPAAAEASWRTPAAAPASSAAEASPAGPLVQVLATALGQSRATLERLQAEQTEIEQLIQREGKQVERLTWLLEKIQQDYSFFATLQKRFEAGDIRF